MDFCGRLNSKFIDEQLYDFGSCWRNFLLTVIMVAYLILFGTIKMIRIKSKISRNLKKSVLYLSLMSGLLFAMLILTTIYCVRQLTLLGAFVSTILVLALNILIYLLAFSLLVIDSWKDDYSPSHTLFWFALLDCIRWAWILKADIQSKLYTNNVMLFAIAVIIMSISVLIVVFVGFKKRHYPENTYEHLEPDRKHKMSLNEQDLESENPLKIKDNEGRASIFSLIFFEWYTPFLFKGYKQDLKESDFYDITDKLRIRELRKSFEAKLKKSGKETFSPVMLISLLFKAFGFEFVIAIILKFINDILIYLNPILLKLLVSFVEEKTNSQEWRGYLYSVLLFVNTFFQALILNQYFIRGFRVGMKIRVFLMGFVYKKSLKISENDKQKQTTGEIVNLMSVDSQSFLDLLPFMSILWSGPFQIAIGIYLLYQEINFASFVGLAIMLVLMIPGNTFIVRRMKTIQKNLMEISDLRIKVTNEVISSMKIIKFYAWEDSFKEKITKIRQKELAYLKQFAYYNCLNIITWNTSSVFVALGAFIYFTKTGGILTSEKAFASISMLNIIRFPLSMFPTVLNSSIVTFVSAKRFSRFLNGKDTVPNKATPDFRQDEDFDVYLRNTSFFWDRDCEKAAIKINGEENVLKEIKIGKGELVMITGRVGSGKSAFLGSLLGELTQKDGDAVDLGEVAYVAQTAWIQNATIRDNILFGNEFDKKWYTKVVQSCCLAEDLKMIKGGEFAEIGERGINLSGGQKQRVSLARAIYSRKNIYLIDDALSALDPQVAQKIMNSCIKDLLKNKTVIFSTNAVDFYPLANKLILIENGKITKFGAFEQIKESLENAFSSDKNETRRDENDLTEEKVLEKIDDTKHEIEFSGSRSRIVSISGTGIENSVSFEAVSGFEEGAHNSEGKLIDREKKETGAIGWKVYKNYIMANGGILMVLVISISFALRQGSDFGVKRFLAFWTDKYAGNNILPENEVTKNILLYAAVSLAAVIAIAFNAFVHVIGALIASKKVSGNLLSAILHAPMTFFDTTPRGRMLNRFSSDTSTLDRSIPRSSFSFLTCFAEVVAILIIISVITPFFIVGLIPLCVMYYFIQTFFIRPTRDIKRIGSTLLSPVYSGFQETLDGTTTIRAFKEEKRFERENNEKLDRFTRVFFSNFIANRWLQVRLELLGSFVVALSSILIVVSRNKLSGGLAGLTLTYALRFVATLNWMIRSAVMLESQVVSVERIMEYTRVQPEADFDIEETRPSSDWPQRGQIELKNLRMRYRPELGFVLNGISLVVAPHEKIGIVGRTGAGKSSLFNCILRINEASEGSITVDGVDISRIGLHQLRSKLTIIPQDPVMFSGTLRFNVDPFEERTDDEILQALEMCQAKDVVLSSENERNGLDFEVTESGSNLSAGERQLICISRALLRQSKILLLDEATSSIDFETDQKIQRAIKTAFSEYTVLTIAHRLKTIMDSDRILVMEQGKVAEFAAPSELLKDSQSLFYKIVNGNEEGF